MAAHRIRVAMLNADVPVPNVFPRWPTYGSIFHSLLKAAAPRVSPQIELISTDYDVQKGEYPSSLSDVDVILITGSAASSYEDVEWIRNLDTYVLDVYENHPRVKMFGSCFGHQLICQSVLRKYGVKAEKDPNGYEIGVQEINVEEVFRSIMNKSSRGILSESSCPTPTRVPEKVRLQFIHGDHVTFPSVDALPGKWMSIGSTSHCAVQGVYEPGRVFTLQGHFEFDRFVNSEVLKYFGECGWPVGTKEHLKSVEEDDDAELMAEVVLRFMIEDEYGTKTTHAGAGGLLTPPSGL